ncbi:hypothetical protein TKK_0001613 [Trichogramma kaykai]
MYQKLEKEIMKGDNDVMLLWNTDGLPVSNSSNGQVWLVQARIVNIPPENRYNFRFVCGVYYSTQSKPTMTAFLRPFVDSLNRLYNSGIDWYDKTTGSIKHSIVIAPFATLDAPARALVQNVMQYNAVYGCTCCEHPGEVYGTGSSATMTYPQIHPDPLLRTDSRVLQQANMVIENNLEHVNGVKGPSIVALIPHFSSAQSFVIDYMHNCLLGILRMLMSMWFDTKNKDYDYYIKKPLRTDIDRE